MQGWLTCFVDLLVAGGPSSVWSSWTFLFLFLVGGMLVGICDGAGFDTWQIAGWGSVRNAAFPGTVTCSSS
jgi:hypothetical protein